MTLPYPQEAETGKLSGPPSRRRPPLPIAELAAEAVFCREGRLYAFGKDLSVEGTRSKEQACDDLRSALISRMQQRLPFAEEQHWMLFSRLMSAQLEHGDSAESATHTAVLTIDGM